MLLIHPSFPPPQRSTSPSTILSPALDHLDLFCNGKQSVKTETGTITGTIITCNNNQFETVETSNTKHEPIYSPTDKAMELDFPFWTSQIKNILQRVEFLETKNRKLQSEVTDLKQLVLEMKHQENIHVQNLIRDSPNLQSKILDIKILQEEMRSQQILFKQEMETQQQTLNPWV
jgi:hypothetical protein